MCDGAARERGWTLTLSNVAKTDVIIVKSDAQTIDNINSGLVELQFPGLDDDHQSRLISIEELDKFVRVLKQRIGYKAKRG